MFSHFIMNRGKEIAFRMTLSFSERYFFAFYNAVGMISFFRAALQRTSEYVVSRFMRKFVCRLW